MIMQNYFVYMWTWRKIQDSVCARFSIWVTQVGRDWTREERGKQNSKGKWIPK